MQFDFLRPFESLPAHGGGAGGGGGQKCLVPAIAEGLPLQCAMVGQAGKAQYYLLHQTLSGRGSSGGDGHKVRPVVLPAEGGAVLHLQLPRLRVGYGLLFSGNGGRQRGSLRGHPEGVGGFGVGLTLHVVG